MQEQLLKRWWNTDMTWVLHYQHQMKSHTPSFQNKTKTKHVMLSYYKNGIEDEERYVEGTAVKVGGAEWLTCVTGLPHGTISTTTNLMDATKWMMSKRKNE
eukprot:scaffold109009_cov47-Attheya_sp.AAC.1